MPQTTKQSIVFTLMTVFFMVYCMTIYTIALKIGGLTGPVFSMAIREMWIEFVVVFCLIFFLVTKTAMRLTGRLFTFGEDKPIFIILSIQCFTVCLIVPMITLFATFFHNGFTAQWFVQWVSLAAYCFPVALCLQVFFVGPLVRWIFRYMLSMTNK